MEEISGVINIIDDIKDLGPLIHHAQPQVPLEEGALYRAQVGPEVIVATKFLHEESGARFRITPTDSLNFDVVLASLGISPEERNKSTFLINGSDRKVDLKNDPIYRYNPETKEYIINVDVLIASAKASTMKVGLVDRILKERGDVLTRNAKRYWNLIKSYMPIDDPTISRPETLEKLLTGIFFQQVILSQNRRLRRMVDITYKFTKWSTEAIVANAIADLINKLFLHQNNPLSELIQGFFFITGLVFMLDSGVNQAKSFIEDRHMKRTLESSFARADGLNGFRLLEVSLNPELPPEIEEPVIEEAEMVKIEREALKLAEDLLDII